MEKFKYGNKEYNIIASLSDDSISHIDFKVTDKVKEYIKFTFLPVYFNNTIYWLNKVQIKKRLYFSSYKIKTKDGEKIIWDKFWEIESIKRVRK